MKIEDKKGNRFEKDVFIGYIVKVKEIVEGIRNINEIEKETIVSIDGGKGILKIVANFIPKNSSESTSKHRHSGARKSIVVFAAEGVDETYFNIKQVIDMIELDKIKFRMSSDLKCLSLIIGIQSQSSKYPCTYCKSSYDSKNGI